MIYVKVNCNFSAKFGNNEQEIWNLKDLPDEVFVEIFEICDAWVSNIGGLCNLGFWGVSQTVNECLLWWPLFLVGLEVEFVVVLISQSFWLLFKFQLDDSWDKIESKDPCLERPSSNSLSSSLKLSKSSTNPGSSVTLRLLAFFKSSSSWSSSNNLVREFSEFCLKAKMKISVVYVSIMTLCLENSTYHQCDSAK